MIYFDNSATTNFKPLKVKLEVLKLLNKKYSANPGRSGHFLSINLGKKIYNARKTFADEFNTDSKNVIFTSSCTEALNTAIFGTVKKSGHIITSMNEHNSVLRGLKKISQLYNIEITFIKPINYIVSANQIEKEIKDNTYMIVLNHTSNVTGMTCDINSIGKLAKKYNLLFLVDAAQSGGHIKIDMKKDNINFLALASHKGFHSFIGCGALLINNYDNLLPFKYGGTGTDTKDLSQPTNYPESLEAGSSSCINILAFEQGLKYTMKNFEKINNKIAKLTKYLYKQLNGIEGVKIYSDCTNSCGVISFTFKNYYSSEISAFLSEKYKICTRSGLHCAPYCHKYLGTLNQGTCRVSVDFKNSFKQIDKLIIALKEFDKNYDNLTEYTRTYF